MIGLRRRRQRRTLFLGALALVLGAVIAVEINGAAHAPSVIVPTASRTPALAQQASPRFALPPLTRYDEITVRPLFSETRRPPLDSAAMGDAQSAAFVLIGIVISPNDRHALIAHGRPLHIDRASVGQELDGWTVRSILSDRVLFASGDRSFELKPRDATPPARDTLLQQQRPGAAR